MKEAQIDKLKLNAYKEFIIQMFGQETVENLDLKVLVECTNYVLEHPDDKLYSTSTPSEVRTSPDLTSDNFK